MQQYRQPDGGRRYRRGARCADADALYSDNARAVDARLTHGAGGEYTRPHRPVTVDVHMGRRDSDSFSWADDDGRGVML